MGPGMAEDPVVVSLANPLILRSIFSYLPFNDLKNCRLVNKIWKFEAGSYIRDFRQCHVSISDVNVCSDLYKLNELVSEMNVVPFNSLSIDFGYTHTVCKGSQPNVYGELLDNMTFRHVDLRGSLLFGRESECPGMSFVILLLREKLAELRTFKVHYSADLLCHHLLKSLGNDWTPMLPKLNILDCGMLWTLQKCFFLKLLSGAPNLQKLKGYFSTLDLKHIPEEKYCLLDSLSLGVSSDEDEERCRKLVEARPALSRLTSFAPYARQYRPGFFNSLEELMASSRKTLKEFHVSELIFPLTRLRFQPMVNLKTLNISTGGEMERVLNILRSTEYAECLPALTEIEIVQRFDYNDEELDQLENALEHIAVPAQPNSSARITKLKLSIDGRESVFQEFSLIFPNVSEIVVRQPDMYFRTEILYHHLWAHWSLLESIYLTEETGAGNFDAEFLGIHPEEVEILREESDESLEKMNIVPVQPCVLTLPRLRSLKIRFYERQWQANPEIVDAHEIFLSKVTGILAFRKLTERGVRIQLASRNPQIISNLSHLMPFAAIVLDDGNE